MNSGSSFHFFNIKRLTRKIPIAERLISAGFAVIPLSPQTAMISIDIAADPINATTAGRMPPRIPCTIIRTY